MTSNRKLTIPFWCLVLLAQIPLLVYYFRYLTVLEIYGWIPLIVMATVVLLVAIRWDRKLSMPLRWPGVSLVGLGLVAAVIAAVEYGWFAIIGLVLTTAGFLAAHHDRQGRSLLTIAPPLIALIRPPLGSSETILQWFAEQVNSFSCQIMRLLEIPYLQYGPAIAIPGSRIYVDDQIQTLWSWPAFMAAALIYGACRRRGWAEALLNALSAVFWCFVFHCGFVVSVAYARNAWDVNLMEGAYLLGTQLIWLLATALLFLSAERGFRCVLFPIEDGADDSRQANPLVVWWNALLDRSRSERSSEEASTSSKRASRLIAGAIGAVAVLGLATICVQAAQVPRVASAITKDVVDIQWQPAAKMFDGIWGQQNAGDHRVVNSHFRSQWGTHADVWTYYLPGRTTEVVVTLAPARWRELAAVYAGSGWTVAEQRQTLTAESDAGEPCTMVEVTLRRGEEYGKLIYSATRPDGKSYALPGSADHDARARCVMVQTFSRFLQPPKQETTQQLASEFALVFSAVVEQLLSGDAPANVSP